MNDERSVMTALRRFKRRETLRIAYGDIIRGQRLETVTSQISYLADAMLEAAVQFARDAWSKSGARRDGPMANALALSCWRWANWGAAN